MVGLVTISEASAGWRAAGTRALFIGSAVRGPTAPATVVGRRAFAARAVPTPAPTCKTRRLDRGVGAPDIAEIIGNRRVFRKSDSLTWVGSRPIPDSLC